jgi:hypothetical protein
MLYWVTIFPVTHKELAYQTHLFYFKISIWVNSWFEGIPVRDKVNFVTIKTDISEQMSSNCIGNLTSGWQVWMWWAALFWFLKRKIN